VKRSTTEARKAEARRIREEMRVSDKQRKKARRMLAEWRKEATEFGASLSRNIDPTKAVQQLLDGAHASWLYAQMQMLQLTEDEYFEEQMGMTVPNKWIREEDRLAGKVLVIAAKASNMGLAERQVRLEEQQAALFGKVVEAAIRMAG
jgi:hypothetical protein